jgi:hypothetical protein
VEEGISWCKTAFSNTKIFEELREEVEKHLITTAEQVEPVQSVANIPVISDALRKIDSLRVIEKLNLDNDHGLSLDQLDDLNKVAEAKGRFDRLWWDFVESVKVNGPNMSESWDKLLEDVEEYAVEVKEVFRSRNVTWKDVGGDGQSTVAETIRDEVEPPGTSS